MSFEDITRQQDADANPPEWESEFLSCIKLESICHYFTNSTKHIPSISHKSYGIILFNCDNNLAYVSITVIFVLS